MLNLKIGDEYLALINRLSLIDENKLTATDFNAKLNEIRFELNLLKAKSNRCEKTSCEHGLSFHVDDVVSFDIWEALEQLYAENAKQADELETKIYSNINSYDFKAMNIKIRARVDFLDIYFEITKPSTRHDIKKFLTEKTGIRHYIKESLNGYVIRLHDMNSLKLLNERLRCLDHFGLLHQSMKIVELEVALDFYGYKHLGLATAILKSLRLPSTANNFRVFKTQTGVFIPIPVNPIALHRKLKDGFNIGINHRLADEYWHIYQKQTDQNGTPLKESEWRIRAEKNIKESVLKRLNNSFSNIRQLLLESFKGLRFTHLKAEASSHQVCVYMNKIDVYGMEKEPYLDSHRNLRKFIPDIEMNAELNRLVVNAVCNLAKNFRHYS
ncbi:hypothetical protein J520_3046 [Acinetobacter sp. 869535]|uniref:hypothetical protein n=1 Tax=Acinetobacter sp. 869535 TaxID=1310621 RepID=UPI000447257B|nr:hypothetical protein [Acinetobacter sp. 869535]EXC25577.1 hypothetical protein J520_3046 [Acinetobacter sp. 869535]